MHGNAYHKTKTWKFGIQKEKYWIKAKEIHSALTYLHELFCLPPFILIGFKGPQTFENNGIFLDLSYSTDVSALMQLSAFFTFKCVD